MTLTSQGVNNARTKNGKYTIGLDIGTSSVGWAVIDDEFNLVRGKKRIIEIDADGKQRTRKSRTNLWGVRLFSEGQTAEKRRQQRGTRRRLERRKKRLRYLQAIFAEEINKFDESFFIRLQESFYHNADTDNKSIQTEYPLFHGTKGAGETYLNDQEYYKEYPTIYHLRYRLINDKSQADLRLIYLALHHILKYRGNFLYQGEEFDLTNIDIAKSFITLHQFYIPYLVEQNFLGAEDAVTELDAEQQLQIQTILSDRQLSKTQKVEHLMELLALPDRNVQKSQKALYTAIVGNGIDLANIFLAEKYKDKELYPPKGNFKYATESEKFMEEFAKIENEATEDEQEIILAGKKVFESIVLSDILIKDTLSESKKQRYEEHKHDLAELKKLARSVSDQLFQDIFKKDGIYTKYVEGYDNPAKHLTKEEFYKALKTAFTKAIKDFSWPKANKQLDLTKTNLTETQKTILTKISNAMETDSYLLKQRTYENGRIPYQIHEAELSQIINNQKRYYPLLGEMVEIMQETNEGEINKKEEYKIQVLMKFRIPYYVGPLAKHVGWQKNEMGELVKTGKASSNSWLVRKSKQEFTPWNFDDVIDKEASAANFIERMTGFCTYLPSEKVLPKNSLLYQEFTIYNELMHCGYMVNNERIYFSPELKQEIVEKLFKKHKKVSAEKMYKFLVNSHEIPLSGKHALFGIDMHVQSPSYNTSYSTYIDLLNADIGDQIIEDHRSIFEEIIKLQTIFEDQKMLAKRLKTLNENSWHHLFTAQQIKKLASKHYTGWGRLSAKLLNGIKTKQKLTIIEHLKTKPYDNFMRLLEDEDIKSAIEKAQIATTDVKALSYDVVENLAGSPKIKKGIWQSLQIVKELETYLGAENINRIVIEMARDFSGSRTKSRRKQIENFQKNWDKKNDEALPDKLKAELAEIGDDKLAKERVYLYFLQNGKCMYTMHDLSLDSLSTYEVDHIIPQSYIKDNSIDNKVLVITKENQNKRDDVPSPEIISKMSRFWEQLAKNGQVSPKKLANLKRGSLSDEAKEGFINRQLVETRQITKHVATILSEHYKDKHVKVLTPKAQLTGQFRDGIIYLTKDVYAAFLQENPELENLASKDAKEAKVLLHEKWVKDRELNDYHHAHDAYLNAVVATYLYASRSDLHEHWVYGAYQKDSDKMFGKYVGQRRKAYRHLLSDMLHKTWAIIDADTGEISSFLPDGPIWQRDEVFAEIRRVLALRNINIVRKTEIIDGKFGDETIYQRAYKQKEIQIMVKAKSSLNPGLYGGRKSPVSALAVAVINKSEEVKILSIPVIQLSQYLTTKDKLKYLRFLYPDEKIASIARPVIAKYTKYILPIGGIRLVASYKEASSGMQLPMLPPKQDDLLLLYRHLATFIKKNRLFTEEKCTLLNDDGKITMYFQQAPKDEQKKIIQELFRVTKGANQNLIALKAAGLGTTAQQLNSKLDWICKGSWLIDQSVTGLYEMRRQL